jgi:hypothetical protein
MNLFQRILVPLKGLLWRDEVIEEIDREMQAHIETETEALIERGMKPDEARATALRNFGNVGRIKDLAYGVRGGGILETIFHDLRFGLRMLIKRPGFTGVAVLTLAVGIGASTAIFSVVDAVLLRPLPYPNPDRLVLVKQSSAVARLTNATLSEFEFGSVREQNHVFSDMAAYANTGFNLTGRGVKHSSLAEKAEPYVYLPQTQQPLLSTYLVVQSSIEPAATVSGIRSELRGLDPNVPLHQVRTLTDLVGQTLDTRKLTDLLLTVFAVLAVVLASVGTYGVMSLYVNNRIKEFGIRLAIGAQPGALLRYVMSQGLSLALAGSLFGIIGAIAFGRLMASMLFEVGSTDPMIFLGVPLLLVAVAIASCYLPARRAMKVDPLRALRHE